MSTPMPKVSVLLTSFNHAKFIREAIDSVLRQTFTDFELLILDDASTDESWWIIKSYADPRIKAIRNPRKGEITFKVIEVISEIATGEYIAVHHSDDVWEPEKLAKQLAWMDAHPDTGAVFTDAGAISEESEPVEGHFYTGIFSQPNRTRQEWLRHFFNHGNALCHPSALIRKRCFEECGYYRPWLWQIDDFDMWIRILLKFEIQVLPEKLTRFRVRNNEANVSGNYRTARIRNFYEYHRVLGNYRAIDDFEDLCKVFPEARKYYRGERTDVMFALGLASLEVAIRPFAQLFSLNLIQEALADPVRAESIRNAYDFTIDKLMELTGRYDVFSLEDVAELNKAAADRSKQLAELQETLSSNAEQLRNFTTGTAERDSLILELDGRLSAHGNTIAQLTGQVAAHEADAAQLKAQVQAREAEVSRQEMRINELSQGIEARDQRLRDANDAIANLGAQSAEQARQAEASARRLNELSQQAAEQEENAASLHRQLEQRAVEADALRNSQSWRLTRPVRFLGRLARRGKRMLVSRRIAALPATAATPMEMPVGTAMPAPDHFDAAFYLERYPDVAAAGADPFTHFVQWGAAEGRLGVRPAAIEALLKTEHPQGIEALAAGANDPDFDEAYYLERYPDIRGAGVVPYEHFINHGRAEGRVASPPKLTVEAGARAVDTAKRSVLIVSHEASRTGAPILSLNIASELQTRFNVVVLLLGGGDLIADFRESATRVAGPALVRNAPQDADRIIMTLCADTNFEFAIVNSIESRVVLRGLAKALVPTVSLIHEFAAYTRPADAFPFAMQWAGETVFSTRITFENAMAKLPALAHTHSHILPQGRCVPPAIEIDATKRALELARVRQYLRPDSPEGQRSFVVIGAGSVQYRKGVDLFMESAARVIRSPGGEICRFVWIGSGYDPEKDIVYSSYLAEQLQRAGLEKQVVFMPETQAIEEAYAMADVLMLSSRLDPLPNVAIDAMTYGLPVVCFADASGIADIIERNDLGDSCVAPYHDTAAMAELILKLARSPQACSDLGERLKRVAEVQFDMQAYVGKLEQLASSAGERLAIETESARVIAKSPRLDRNHFLRTPQAERSTEDVARDYVRSWSKGIDRRKPFPGFNPEIYAAKQAVGGTRLDPLADWLDAGEPEGPWNFEVIRSGDPLIASPNDLRTALHLHVFYPELLPDILERLAKNRNRPALFISVPDDKSAELVREHTQAYVGKVATIQVVPNRGRDLAPLLTAFGEELVAGYDIVGHVHTKKSLDTADAAMGSTWHRFLMENLLGGKAPMMDIVMGRMSADASMGLVFADDPHIVGWGLNLPYAEALASRLALGVLPRHPVFPVGSMFWARSEAIRPLVDLKLEWSDYPPEPLPYDGSMLHAIERLLPLVAESQSVRIALTHVDGVTR